MTNIATQALFWMNSDFVTTRSANLARELLKAEGLDDAGRVRSAYLRILNRPATDQEVRDSLQFVAGFRARQPKADSVLPWQSICRVLMSSNEFIYLD